jgi:glutamate synthase (ferredoxin)
MNPPTTLWRPEFEHDACGIGALASLDNVRSHRIVDDALSVLVNLEHRGGVGLEKNTGDGAGILLQIPHRFFRKEAQKNGAILADEGRYGVAMLFLPADDAAFDRARHLFERSLASCGIELLFWREVPTDPRDLGTTARACMPRIWQAFVGRPASCATQDEFERALYVARRTVEKDAAAEPALSGHVFYVCSMSSRTIVYKGMLLASQMRRFFPDLDNAQVETALALVHSRYSTNTTPSWQRAHPNRYLIHNGEINTLKGNVNWIRAREPELYSPLLGADLDRVLPVIAQEGSDSAMLDNVFEFLVMNGRTMDRAMSMLVPEPWDKVPDMPARRRSFDRYQSMLMEPWDGPAALAFTDGVRLGAQLDRNGLRPARYYLTRDNRFLLASEVGTIDIDPANILSTGCLGPGEMLMVDPVAGRVVYNDELRDNLASSKPFADWIAEEAIPLASLDGAAEKRVESRPLATRLATMGIHYDDVDEVVRPLAETAKPPIASMGVDIAPACMSPRPQSFFNYFNQLFAQVTNPPIDALREEMVTSTVMYLGNHGNMLEDTRDNCRLVALETPILDADGFAKIESIDRIGFKSKTFRTVFVPAGKSGALEAALDALCAEVADAVRTGVNIVILSDRTGEGEVPVPSLLATGAVHHHLIRCGLRTRADLVVESGDALSPHDFAALIGYSAAAVHPYLAHELVEHLAETGQIEADPARALENYDRGVLAGVVAIASKMGISTIQGYHSAQIFEALGLSRDVVDRCFTGTPTRIGGLGFDDIERELLERMEEVRELEQSPAPDQLSTAGTAVWRPLAKEKHAIDPETIYLLQRACRENDPELFAEYEAHIRQADRPLMLRDLFELSSDRAPVDLSEVEPASEIVKRFNTGAMSFGSISQEAHETLAIAMNRLGGKSNTGEGGESPLREIALPSGDSKRSKIKQVASGRFGVTSRYLASADEIQIKMAQGAKPGEGGHLPGKKVYPWVAEVRRSTPGVGLISPPPHHDIYSIEDLAELIYDLRNANPGARISVKLCAEAGVGTIATGVAKGGADKVLISGANGGTGAAPRDSIYHAGLPWELGLSEAHQTLVRNGLRSRVTVETDGKLMTGHDVAIACLLGAEEFGFATMPLIVLGCLMQRDCQKDTCPAGIATQNVCLRHQFRGRPEDVVNFMHFIAEGLRREMAALGFTRVEDMVGHVECLKQRASAGAWKTELLDLSQITAPATCAFEDAPEGACALHALPEMAYKPELDRTLDETLLVPYTAAARSHLNPVSVDVTVDNMNRCVGTLLGYEVTRSYPDGLPEGLVKVACEGSGGQSFGAFLPAGVELDITGDANDYVGKGLSGGTISVHPSPRATYKFAENISIGNVAFYGATGGKGFVNGRAGQRFGVRNSGATLVVEGCGNHGLEYMTGGLALVLGRVGRNFAAGMSGGIAYVYDELDELDRCVNKDMVDVRPVTDADAETIRALIEEHVGHTKSPLGIKMLYRFDDIRDRFRKIVPPDYERVTSLVEAEMAAGKTRAEAEVVAFDAMVEGR